MQKIDIKKESFDDKKISKQKNICIKKCCQFIKKDSKLYHFKRLIKYFYLYKENQKFIFFLDNIIL